MTKRSFWILIAAVGFILLLLPLFYRTAILRYDSRTYEPPAIPVLSVASTPKPTGTPAPLMVVEDAVETELRPGPVIVDLAHGNRIDRSSFQPLSTALATHGLGLKFWISEVDILALDNFFDYPDQSADLAKLLGDASALVVISPFFLWSSQEIALVERFVADGGRLLLISDPDVTGDAARDINNLGEPFGVIFNEDYLYDTKENDENFVHIFLDQFVDQASDLADNVIALYGARSISGDIRPQAISAETTLSSLRSGVSGLTTVALGDMESNQTAGRVLALSDVDVLTEPYVSRHDNRRVVEFAASFLANGERTNTVTDFPAYLGKEVALIFGDSDSVDSELLKQGAKLQTTLEQSGRSLTLTSATAISATQETDGDAPGLDVIYLADYESANGSSGVLASLGLELVEEIEEIEAEEDSDLPSSGSEEGADAAETPVPPTATVEASENVTVTATPAISVTTALSVATDAAVTMTTAITANVEMTASATTDEDAAQPEEPTATPTPSPTPEVKRFIVTEDGLRLVAEETLLIDQSEDEVGNRRIAVLANNSEAIGAGVNRLLTRDYAGCVTAANRVICSFDGNGEAAEGKEDADGAASDSDDAAQGRPTPTGEPADAPAEAPPTAMILVVDDDRLAADGETSEADTYLKQLTALGYRPDLWSTLSKGTPTSEEMGEYDWVIWSGGGYEVSGPDPVNDLQSMFEYLNTGGNLTVSSRRPFFGAGKDEPSVITDVVIETAYLNWWWTCQKDQSSLPMGYRPLRRWRWKTKTVRKMARWLRSVAAQRAMRPALPCSSWPPTKAIRRRRPARAYWSWGCR
ncbi:MAG: hypothetical protein HC802_02310 [Caldilineaceae bacterium]|nr:hypothetical protein [Caldilineaceae bacterium]